MKCSQRCSVASPLLLVAALLLRSLPAEATPPLWDPQLGGVLPGLADQDDADVDVALSFAFPFAGSTYDALSVGTNGGIALGAGHSIAPDGWFNFDGEFLHFGSPVVYPFETDLSQVAKGQILFADTGNRAVITWLDVGSYQNELASFTLQAQLHSDGTLVFAYAELPADLNAELDDGIVIGVTAGDGSVDPGLADFRADAPFASGTTVYQVWCSDDPPSCGVAGEPNSAFDLHGASLRFTPEASGFAVSFLPEPSSFSVAAAAAAGLACLRCGVSVWDRRVALVPAAASRGVV